MATLLDNLSEQAKRRIEVAADKAESKLQEQLIEHFSNFDPDSLKTNTDAHKQLLGYFEQYASDLFDAYADVCIELFGDVEELNKYLQTLRTDVVDRIASQILPDEYRHLNDEVLEEYWQIHQELASSPSGIWESTLQDCWSTITARNPATEHHDWLWKWRFQHIMRMAENLDPFPQRLKTYLEHRIPSCRAKYRERWTDPVGAEESPRGKRRHVQKQLSQEDRRLHNIIGSKDFEIRSNPEIRRRHRAQIKKDFGASYADSDAFRSRLNRIRRTMGYPSSDQIRKKRST